MKKRTMGFAAFFAMLALCTNIYAAEAIFDRNTGKVTVSGDAGANEHISVAVLKPNVSVEDITNASKLKNGAKLFYEITAAEDGKYEAVLNLGDESGVFTILLSGDTVKESLSAEVISTQETAEYLKKLSEAAANNTVKAALEDERLRKVLDLEELYKNESTRDELAELLTNKKEFNDISDIEAIRKPMQDRIDCVKNINSMINKAQVKDLIKQVYELLGTSDSAYTKYMKMTNTDEVDKRIFEGKPYDNLADVREALKKAVDSAGSSSGSGSGSGSGGGSGSGSSSGGKGSYATGNIIKNDYVKPDNSENDGARFKDVPNGHWAKESVEYLAENGIVNGKTEDTFEPDETVKREEFVKMLVGAIQLTVGGEADTFADTDKSAWYSKYLFAANKAGLVYGKDDGSFGIGETLTRQDMAVMVYRAMKIKNAGIEENGQKTSFSDYDSIAEYARESIDVLSSIGIINGMEDNRFSPDETATRAQAAQVIGKLMKLEGIR